MLAVLAAEAGDQLAAACRGTNIEPSVMAKLRYGKPSSDRLYEDFDGPSLLFYCPTSEIPPHHPGLSLVHAAVVISANTSCLEFLLNNKYLVPSEGVISPYTLRCLTQPRHGRLFDAMKLLLEHGLDPETRLDTLYGRGLTLLAAAAEQGHVKLVKLLLLKNAKLLNSQSPGAPLEQALMGKHAEVAECLIEAHQKRKVELPKTVLGSRFSFHSVDFLKLLLEAIDRGPAIDDSMSAERQAETRSEYKHTVMNWRVPLDHTVPNRHAPPDAPAADLRGGFTPLHRALKQEEPEMVLEMVKLLLEHGADANHGDEQEMTPLMHAALKFDVSKESTVEVCRLLLLYGGDPNFYTADKKEDSFSRVGLQNFLQKRRPWDRGPSILAFAKLWEKECKRRKDQGIEHKPLDLSFEYKPWVRQGFDDTECRKWCNERGCWWRDSYQRRYNVEEEKRIDEEKREEEEDFRRRR